MFSLNIRSFLKALKTINPHPNLSRNVHHCKWAGTLWLRAVVFKPVIIIPCDLWDRDYHSSWTAVLLCYICTLVVKLWHADKGCRSFFEGESLSLGDYPQTLGRGYLTRARSSQWYESQRCVFLRVRSINSSPFHGVWSGPPRPLPGLESAATSVCISVYLTIGNKKRLQLNAFSALNTFQLRNSWMTEK